MGKPLVLVAFGGLAFAWWVGCSTAPAAEASADAETYTYQSDCPDSPSISPGCTPQFPVETEPGEIMCVALGIHVGDSCRPGDRGCLGRRGLVEGLSPDGAAIDSGSFGPCYVRAEHLTCRAGGPRGCPSSSATVKKQIHYLTPAEVSEAAHEIRNLPLVRYRYKSQGDGVTPTVGIVIEDVPGASFVDRENQRVNLYSFVSATAAAYQAQAKELEDVKARLAAVEARCGDAEAAKTRPAGQAAPAEKRLELRP